ncbi:MAG: efflux RND transporter periplasmic adaptor subunit [Lentimicrobium sp.]|nr:efflux RND transporter periplasmic adaptor subunit [Lentimicrobium sp.]
MNTRNLLSAFALAALLFTSCGTKNAETQDEETSADEAITLSRTQFESSEMILGKPEKMKFTHKIRANGKVSASPSGQVQISSMIPGRIRQIAVNIGDRVNKGQMLCAVESSELIQLQMDYAESSGRLKSVQAEFERQQSLAGENIASQKTYLNAEAEYKSLIARCEGLKAKLLMLGLNAEKAGQGIIVKEMVLTAPIGGVVSALFVETGSFAEPQKALMELVDLNQLQLKLSVFEKDLTGLKPGLKISFFSPNNPSSAYSGELLSYSRTMNQETRAITVIGSIQPSDRPLMINGMYIEADIFTGEKEVMALPDEAILKSGNSRLVLVQTSSDGKLMNFVKKEVKTGLSSNGFTEILNPEGLENVLVKGGFNLVME